MDNLVGDDFNSTERQIMIMKKSDSIYYYTSVYARQWTSIKIIYAK